MKATQPRKNSPRNRKEYLRNYQRVWLAQRRAAWLSEHGPCVRCGSWDRLEVDHIDPSQKVTHRVWSWSYERRVAELSKCQVLCYSCHRDKSGRGKGPTHGTITAYSYHRCRCDLCRRAHAECEHERRMLRASEG